MSKKVVEKTQFLLENKGEKSIFYEKLITMIDMNCFGRTCTVCGPLVDYSNPPVKTTLFSIKMARGFQKSLYKDLIYTYQKLFQKRSRFLYLEMHDRNKF